MSGHIGVATDYDRSEGRGRDYLTLWAGPFASTYVGEAVSLPRGDGYMVNLMYGPKVRVSCPTPRTDGNWMEVDDAIRAAITSSGYVVK